MHAALQRGLLISKLENEVTDAVYHIQKVQCVLSQGPGETKTLKMTNESSHIADFKDLMERLRKVSIESFNGMKEKFPVQATLLASKENQLIDVDLWNHLRDDE